MGGFGSGRHAIHGTTESRPALDVRKLQREGLLSPGSDFLCHCRAGKEEIASFHARTEADHVILAYDARTDGGAWQQMEYPVLLEWTPCRFGGRRAWFLCPHCGLRVAILYGGPIFACRYCHGLAYTSQRELPEYRAMRRADKLRKRLGWPPGIGHPTGDKPPGMHKATFDRLKAQHDAFVDTAPIGMAKRLDRIAGRLK